jgi:hypothetical protein
MAKKTETTATSTSGTTVTHTISCGLVSLYDTLLNEAWKDYKKVGGSTLETLHTRTQMRKEMLVLLDARDRSKNSVQKESANAFARGEVLMERCAILLAYIAGVVTVGTIAVVAILFAIAHI